MDNNNNFNNGYDSENLFDSPVWNPGGAHERRHSRDFEDIAVKEARSAFNRFGLAVFCYLLIANLIAVAGGLVLSIFYPEKAAEISESYLYIWGMNVLSMYVIAFPILFLIVKGMPSSTREKKALSLKEFLALFAVAEFFMYVGNYVGTVLNGIIGGIIGDDISNQVSELIDASPLWVIILVAVLIGPIIEELIFRKLLIDKLSRFGDKVAIVVSAVAFGFFHGNLYQLFYAALIGAILAYVYVKTGNILYPMLMHVILNFVGSVVVIPVIDAQDIIINFASGEYMPQTAEQMKEFIMALILMCSYSIIQLTLVGIGIFVFVRAIKEKAIRIDRSPEIAIPRERAAGAVLKNAGAILFLIICSITMVISLFVK